VQVIWGPTVQLLRAVNVSKTVSKSDNPFDRITQSEINITDSLTVNPDTFDPASKNEITTKATSAAALNPPDIITGFI
jgi:hypothetical protein